MRLPLIPTVCTQAQPHGLHGFTGSAPACKPWRHGSGLLTQATEHSLTWPLLTIPLPRIPRPYAPRSTNDDFSPERLAEIVASARSKDAAVDALLGQETLIATLKSKA